MMSNKYGQMQFDAVVISSKTVKQLWPEIKLHLCNKCNMKIVASFTSEADQWRNATGKMGRASGFIGLKWLWNLASKSNWVRDILICDYGASFTGHARIGRAISRLSNSRCLWDGTATNCPQVMPWSLSLLSHSLKLSDRFSRKLTGTPVQQKFGSGM